MNKRTTKAFILLHENRVIFFETNMSAFFNIVADKIDKPLSLSRYYQIFKAKKVLKVKGKNGEDFVIQRLL